MKTNQLFQNELKKLREHNQSFEKQHKSEVLRSETARQQEHI